MNLSEVLNLDTSRGRLSLIAVGTRQAVRVERERTLECEWACETAVLCSDVEE